MKKQKRKRSKLQETIRKLKDELLGNKHTYILLGVLLLVGLFLRVYRAGQILGFYFDQGRDAMQIWELIHQGDVFLIGPTTGIAGIFRGPFYYYLITPFYWLSMGDPVLPANFLALTTIIASGVLYYLAMRAQNRTAGIITVLVSICSFYLIFASRWLSNPTPMFLLSTLLLLFMFMVNDGKKWAWTGIALVSGTSLFHFGSSGEFFYFPAIFVFAIWQRKNFPNLKIIFTSVGLFLFTALPLILFDFKNGHLLSNNIRSFLFERESFQSDFWVVAQERVNFYYSTFASELFPNLNNHTNTILLAFGISFLLFLPKFLRNDKIKIVLLVFLSPLVGLLFFQGNEGNIYGYYLTGYYLIFILLFGIIAGKLWESIPGKILVGIFLLMFVFENIPLSWQKMNDGADGTETIVLKNQKQAIEWIYQDAGGREFNFDVYVPPVIPHAYDYLFTWYPTTFRHRPELRGASESKLVEERIELLYTLYEVDPPHPERLEAWKARQDGIGSIQEEKSFGGITVQRRSRILYTD